MIAKFPNFSKLDISHQNEILDFTSQFDPYSDFNFTSLFSWNIDNSSQISILNENLIILLPDYISGDPVYSILGNNKIDESLIDLFQITDKLKLIPEVVVENISNKVLFEIIEDNDNNDYIVSSADLARLSPEKFAKKHLLVEKFKQNNPDLDVRYIPLDNSKARKVIVKSFEKWRKVNNKPRDVTRVELKAIKRLLDNVNHLKHVNAVGIYDAKKLIAFNIFESLENGYGLSSFQKAIKRSDGLYAMLTQEMSKYLVDMNCEYINFEQDLGIEGLRNSKRSYHPVKLLKKYLVYKIN
ncbi:MAG TPA: phosphatidylglycerol lysyltransferase domain-containing protein [Candidatus Saccharimonadales bacterium]|nr:phosphatidylglycerol lysyltransferase domain-containing protein [Candidatus Saccharimonadales bacterium]